MQLAVRETTAVTGEESDRGRGGWLGLGSASPREEEKLILIMVRLNLTGSPVSEQQRELLTKRNKITASK